MIKFLIYLSVVLFLILVARLAGVAELANKLRGGNNDNPTHKDNKTQGIVFASLIIGLVLFVFWEVVEHGKKLLPVSASEHGVLTDWLMNVNMVLIFIPFVLTHVILAYFAYKYAGRGQKATFIAHNNKLEMIWTIIPAIVLTFVISYGLKTWNAIQSPAGNDAIVVELYAKQFDWTARYAGKDNTLGKASFRLIGGSNDLGVDMNDKASADDFLAKGEFHIPLGKEISFKFNSRDVIHSAYFPHFRAQMNCVPGMVTMLHFKPTITTKEMRAKLGNEKFDYVLLCNKICGAAHYNMQIAVVVDTPGDYAVWVSQQKTLSTTLTPVVEEAPKAEAKADSAATKLDSTAVAMAEKEGK